jgi:hypothetical protein
MKAAMLATDEAEAKTTRTHTRNKRDTLLQRKHRRCKTRATSRRRQKQATRVGKEELKKLPILLSKEDSFATLRADQRSEAMEPQQQQQQQQQQREEAKSSAAKWSREIGSS